MEKDNPPVEGVVNESELITALMELYGRHKRYVEVNGNKLNERRLARPELATDPEFNFQLGAIACRNQDAQEIRVILEMYAGRDIDTALQELTEEDSQQ